MLTQKAERSKNDAQDEVTAGTFIEEETQITAKTQVEKTLKKTHEPYQHILVARKQTKLRFIKIRITMFSFQFD